MPADSVTVLKALADETRLRIMSMLWEAEELCSCEIEGILELNQPNVSRHLSRLRQAGLVAQTKRGHWVHLRIAGGAFSIHPYLTQLIQSARADTPSLPADLARLRDYRESGYDCRTIGQWAGSRPGVRDTAGRS